MNNSFSESYKAAGVDVTAGYKAVELMKKHVAATRTSGVLSNIGGFGGLFAPNLVGIKEPVLISGTDGVGTKLKIAFLMDKHDTVGIDCVAMCVNDIACAGAQPLFFLDYIACGKNFPEKIEQLVKGISDGCISAEAALIGGETAEMPGFYPIDEYDMAGFAVGIADKVNIIDGTKVKHGMALIGIASSGVHSNGFSLVRKALQVSSDNINTYVSELGKTLGEELLTPTKIYVKPLKALYEKVRVYAVSNITGGGFYENIPRMLPAGISCIVNRSTIKEVPIFSYIQKLGEIPERDMFNTFNMGVGLVLAVDFSQVEQAIQILKENGETAFAIGETIEGEGGISIC